MPDTTDTPTGLLMLAVKAYGDTDTWSYPNLRVRRLHISVANDALRDARMLLRRLGVTSTAADKYLKTWRTIFVAAPVDVKVLLTHPDTGVPLRIYMAAQVNVPACYVSDERDDSHREEATVTDH